MYPDEGRQGTILDEVFFNDFIRPIVVMALTDDKPYWTAAIWVHNEQQKIWGEALRKIIAEELGPEKCLRQSDRIFFLYAFSLNDIPLGTMSWFPNYLIPPFTDDSPRETVWQKPPVIYPRE